jgi:ABC-2 type transport system ATP-binding protein
MSDNMELEVINVTKIIDKKTILDNINLKLTGGRIYGLRGKNGAGKTMLFRLISGLILPTEGKVLIDGEELGQEISFPRSIGILIENPGYIPNFSGYKNLKMIANIKGIIGDVKIKDTMTLLGLDPLSHKKVKKYSLGMKQKLGVAMAVMEDPYLILLDEPINALDEASVRIVHDLLQKHKERGALILVASHDRDELDLLADEILVMENGRMIGVE